MNQQDMRNRLKKTEWILRIKGILSGAVPVIIMGLILFISAGTVNWPMAWFILGVLFISTTFVTLFCDPDLIVERTNKQKGGKDWDNRLLKVMNLTGFLTLLVAGLDMRYDMNGEIPDSIFFIAITIFLFSYCFLSWAILKNPFFSLIVRIQDERDHHVIISGPYQIVRHPGYLGLFLITLTQPLILGSLLAIIPGVITGVLLILRTSIEDDTLFTELNGYCDYAQNVRYRLFPGAW